MCAGLAAFPLTKTHEPPRGRSHDATSLHKRPRVNLVPSPWQDPKWSSWAQVWSTLVRNVSTLGQFWPVPGQIWSRLVEIGPTLVESGPNLADFGRFWPKSSRRRPIFTQFGLKFAQVWPNSDGFGPSSTQVGLYAAKSWRVRPKLGRCGQNSAREPRLYAARVPER